MKMSIAVILALFLVSAEAGHFSVTDGDSLRIDGAAHRIANIDAPELRHAQCDAERRLAMVAKRRLTELLASGKIEVTVGDPQTGRTFDRFQRILATITVDGRDVGAILIEEGLARPWDGRRHPWCDTRSP
jgi:endonuclease YncB( thermonuclease family)